MSLLPRRLEKIGVPPIKCQGIKTKLVRPIFESLKWNGKGRWIEPFVGSGVVAFNLAPPRALLADANEHLIALYRAIQSGEMNRKSAEAFLVRESEKLSEQGEPYYYQVRERFNSANSPFDFLFLNRSCFNGVMRFNRKGKFNVPFCHKPERFSRSYITKIINQIDWVKRQMHGRDWTFEVADWKQTLNACAADDFVYADPPYIGRHTDYYASWGMDDAEALADTCRRLPGGFAASMWLENRYRRNDHVDDSWHGLELRVFEHFYHVGSTEDLRNKMDEVLIIKPGFAADNAQFAAHIKDEPLPGLVAKAS